MWAQQKRTVPIHTHPLRWRIGAPIIRHMDEASLVISIASLLAALILAGFGTLLQWLVSKDTRQQATDIRKDIGDFKSEASSLLGEIRGLTTQTRESQERQFDTMLQWFIDKTKEAASTSIANAVESIDAVDEAIQQQKPSEQVRDELRQARNLVEHIPLQVQNAVDELTPGTIAKIVAFTVNPVVASKGGRVRVDITCLALAPRYLWPGDYPPLVSCGVTAPDGKMFTRKSPMLFGTGRGEGFLRFDYPLDFPEADSETMGEYIVTAQVWSTGDHPQLLDRADVSFSVL